MSYSIQVTFRRVALSYRNGVLIYKDGRSNRCLGAMGQVFLRTAPPPFAGDDGRVSSSTVAVGDFSELGGGHIDVLFERGVECRF